MSEELDRWDFEIAEGMKERKMTGYVYDDKAPNGRATEPEQIRNLPLTDFELEVQAQLDRIENLLVTVLGHVSPGHYHYVNSDEWVNSVATSEAIQEES